MIVCLESLHSALLSSLTQAAPAFRQGRIIAGLGVGALSAVVPLYQSEIAPKEIRGT